MKKKSTKPSGDSVYGRKIRGDFPPNSPYRTRWSDCIPFGYRKGAQARGDRQVSK